MSDKKQRQAAADLGALRLRIGDIMSTACQEEVDNDESWLTIEQIVDAVRAMQRRLFPDDYPAYWTELQNLKHYETVAQATQFLWDQGLRADGTIVKEES